MMGYGPPDAMQGGGYGPPDAPPDAMQGGDTGDSPVDAEELLSGMLQLATLFTTQENDHSDRLKIEKARTLIQQVLADRESDSHQLLGSNRALARVAGR